MHGFIVPPKALTQLQRWLSPSQADAPLSLRSDPASAEIQVLVSELSEFVLNLQAQEARMNAALDATDDAVIVIDEQGRMEDCNPAGLFLFGYTKCQLLGQDIRLLLPDGDRVCDHLKSLARRDSSRLEHEWMAMRKDGSRFPVRGVFTPVNQSALFVCLLRDMSAIRQMEQALLETVEEERNRIGRDLHDSIAQCLVGMAMQARGTALRLKRLDREEGALFDQFYAGLRSIAQGVYQTIQELVPLELEHGNLREALQRLIVEPMQGDNVEIHLSFLQDLVFKAPKVSLHLLRIAQEAVHNAVRHAQATRIDISVIKEHGCIRLSIADNGIGLSGEDVTARSGNGLRNMHYRARALGAGLELRPNIPAGLIVECTLHCSV